MRIPDRSQYAVCVLSTDGVVRAQMTEQFYHLEDAERAASEMAGNGTMTVLVVKLTPVSVFEGRAPGPTN